MEANHSLGTPTGRRIRFSCLVAAFLIEWAGCGLVAGLSPCHASELTTLMAGLESDGTASAKGMLALGPEVNSQPEMVQCFVQAARTIGRQGHWELSIALLQRARGTYLSQSEPATGKIRDPSFVHTLDLAIASAAIQCSEFDLACEHCGLVIEDRASPIGHRAAAYPLFIKAHLDTKRLSQAADVACGAISKDAAAVTPGLVDLGFTVGAACLEAKQFGEALEVYECLDAYLLEGARTAEARLGAAWAAALGAEEPEPASIRLESFVSQFPEHLDAAHALRAAATCLDRAGQTDKAENIRAQLLRSYPQSDAAVAVLLHYTRATSPADALPWPTHVRQAWTNRMNGLKDNDTPLNREQLAGVLNEALRASDDNLWQASLNRLIAHDADGVLTDALFKQFAARSQDGLAEHLAIDLIGRSVSVAKSSNESDDDNQTVAPPLNVKPSPAATEAACRWAGASERWSILALAADEMGPPNETSGRTIVTDRLMAESLMQMQRPLEAMPWWDWLIDQRGASDFATLLRGAETAVAHGEINVANDRIEAARQAAGNESFNRALTQILAAELAIRRARFDEARESLNDVVRAVEPSVALRPRAQWLIGETYFMQQKYSEAIDAYRRVDAMDSAGEWAPTALLQAGKAFEKLGRGRDAVVCYTALLSRFRDWPHVGIAQSRLAALGTTDPHKAPVLR